MIWLLCTRYVGRWRRQKRLYFSIVFSVTLRGLSCAVIVMPRGRRGGGKEQCDRWLQGTVQQCCSALSLSCLHGSPLGSGVLGAPICRGSWWAQPALLQWTWGNGTCICEHLPKVTAWGFIQGPPIALSPGWPQWFGKVARCQLGHGHREQVSCVQRKALHTFLKHFVLLPSVPLQDLGNPLSPCRACFCEGFRSLALLSASMQLHPNQRVRTAL